MKWTGVLFALVLVAAAFLPWVSIASRSITITGIDSSGTNWGKPGNLHFVMAALFVIFSFLPFIWAKRINIFVAGINVAWAFRNFIMLAGCEGGECPDRKIGLYLSLFASLVMLLASLFPDIELKENKPTN